MNAYEWVAPYEAQMIADRRWLHAHPELSGEEEDTLDYIERALKALGLQIHRVREGGLIGVMNADAQGKCLLLRADVDALPIKESERNPACARTCVSGRPGVMHACGHDAHIAMQLCAARALKAAGVKAPVLFVFEQGEEKNGFIRQLLPYIDVHFDVGMCYATHVRWDIPSGHVAVLDGAAMAGAFGFDVMLRGHGGHGSRPDLAVSPVDCFCDIHQQISALRMREIAPDAVLTYSLGLVRAGETPNVIPDTLRFAGTVRTYDTRQAAERFAAGMKRIIAGACAAHGCAYTLTRFTNPLYETRNFPAAAKCVRDAVNRLMGEGVLVEAAPWMASETMSAYLRLWPGVLSFTGIRNMAAGSGANHHTPDFDVDEAALKTGAAAAVACALDFDSRRPSYGFARDIVSMEDLLSRSI